MTKQKRMLLRIVCNPYKNNTFVVCKPRLSSLGLLNGAILFQSRRLETEKRSFVKKEEKDSRTVFVQLGGIMVLQCS